ncbi:hypothetical protein VN12_23360 [Pirellula sp. SH-Sr6A]|nr:hypothetical protein VN12_23360 [Pirellula sp. SH-Sr6A]
MLDECQQELKFVLAADDWYVTPPGFLGFHNASPFFVTHCAQAVLPERNSLASEVRFWKSRWSPYLSLAGEELIGSVE